MSASYLKILADVTGDRRSGAWQVSKKAVKCVEQLSREFATSDAQTLIAELERVSAEILKAQTGMAQLVNFFNSVFVMIEEESSMDAVVFSRKISGEARRFLELSENAVAKVATHGAELISNDGIVFIHSNSSTIMEIVKSARTAGKVFDIILTESRPLNEGRACAVELSQMDIQTTYLVDAASAKGVDRADVILLGADTVSENTLINKIGSRAICLLAREAVVPCYLACESSKFISRKLGPKREQPRNSVEVWKSPPDEITVENYYFDEVALEQFTGVIMEDGILTPEETSGMIRSRKMSRKLVKMLK